MNTYEQECSAACEHCAKSCSFRVDGLHMFPDGRSWRACIAPTKDEYINKLLKEIDRLERFRFFEQHCWRDVEDGLKKLFKEWDQRAVGPTICGCCGQPWDNGDGAKHAKCFK